MGEIELRQLTKRFADGTEAVKGIDLTIHDGELMILVGPSGCGKTTALRMIAGLEEITSGTLRIGDELVNHLPPKRRDIAMVFQSYALYPHMTVAENMGFALRLAKIGKGEIKQRVEAAAAILDLGDHLERKPANLSGGQRQRVAMGRAIVRSPQAFLMDEPLSNLDAKLRVQMRVEVARLQQRLGTTTVYVTHDQTEAMTLGHRVAVMRGGLIQQVDTPQRLYETPANTFVAGFIGSPPMNLLPGRLRSQGVELPFGTVPMPEFRRQVLDSRAERDVIVGIRPEAFADASLPGSQGEGPVFEPKIDVVEAMGAELYAYFDVTCPTALPSHLADAFERGHGTLSGGRENVRQVVARLPVASRATAGHPTRLQLNPRALAIFDIETGANLAETAPRSSEIVNGAHSESDARHLFTSLVEPAAEGMS